jgi:hypothetical protein
MAQTLMTDVRYVHAFVLILNSQEPRMSAALFTLRVFIRLFGTSFMQSVVIGFSRWGYDKFSRASRIKNRKDEHKVNFAADWVSTIHETARQIGRDDITCRSKSGRDLGLSKHGNSYELRFTPDTDDFPLVIGHGAAIKPAEFELAHRERKAKDVNAKLREALGHTFDCPCLFLDNNANAGAEDLHDVFGDEVQAAVGELDEQFEKLWKFMSSVPALDCAAEEALRVDRCQRIRRLEPAWSDDSCRLDQRVARDVLFDGWLWWRGQWIFGVLQKHTLRFYRRKYCGNAEPTYGPNSGVVDLLDCVCSPVANPLFSRQVAYFALHWPLGSGLRLRFGVESIELEQQWRAAVTDAAQKWKELVADADGQVLNQLQHRTAAARVSSS